MSSITLRSIPSRLAAAGAAAAACAALAAPAAHAAGQYVWSGGVDQFQKGDQCGYGGTTGVGINTAGSVAYWTNPSDGYPAVGDRYLMRIRVDVLGFSCAGGISDFDTELLLPADTAPAIDLSSGDPVDRVRCFYESATGQITDVTDQTWVYPGDSSVRGKMCDSTKIPTMGTYGYDLGGRIAPQGASFWVDMPVVSYKKLDGTAGAGYSSTMGAAISSGLNSFINPTQWVTVFDRPAAVRYPADATTAVTDTTARTKATLDAFYRKGKAYVDFGTGASGDYQATAGPIAIDGNWANYTVTQDWGQLTPGTTHHWRLRFVDEQGVTTAGAPQTFTTTGTAPSGGGSTGPKPGSGGSSGTGGTGTGGGTGAGGGTITTPGGGTSTTTTTTTTATGGGAAPVPQGGGAQPAGATQATNKIQAPPTIGAVTLARGTRLSALTGAGAKLTLACSRACRAAALLEIDAKTAKRLHLGGKSMVLASGAAATTTGGTVTIRLKASRAVAKALRHARSVTATLTATVDGGTVASRRVTLRR